MDTNLQFFIEFDNETMRRFDVTPAADGSYGVTTTMQFDAGWEKPETILNFSDKKKLARHLINEGSPLRTRVRRNSWGG
jgi:hypothetical protein